MKKVLLVSGAETSKRDLVAFMADTLGEEVECYQTYLRELCYTISPGYFQVFDTRNRLDLKDVDVVFIRGVEKIPVSEIYYLSRYCEWSGTECISDYSLYVPPDKLSQAILFLEQGVSFLKTLYCQNREVLIGEAEKAFKYPYILKASLASSGNSNYLVKSLSEARWALKEEPQTDFLAQEYCPNDHDYRLLIIGDEFLLFERRGSVESHLNNTSKGGKATIIPNALPASIILESRKLAKCIGLKIAGVDIVPNIDTGTLYFLEVNIQPQLRTGAFLEEKKVLLRKLFDDIY
jgi:glutathione synthase/RimK-type ligase-like ATP-grasp enzyme